MKIFGSRDLGVQSTEPGLFDLLQQDIDADYYGPFNLGITPSDLSELIGKMRWIPSIAKEIGSQYIISTYLLSRFLKPTGNIFSSDQTHALKTASIQAAHGWESESPQSFRAGYTAYIKAAILLDKLHGWQDFRFEDFMQATPDLTNGHIVTEFEHLAFDEVPVLSGSLLEMHALAGDWLKEDYRAEDARLAISGIGLAFHHAREIVGATYDLALAHTEVL